MPTYKVYRKGTRIVVEAVKVLEVKDEGHTWIKVRQDVDGDGSYLVSVENIYETLPSTLLVLERTDRSYHGYDPRWKLVKDEPKL